MKKFKLLAFASLFLTFGCSTSLTKSRTPAAAPHLLSLHFLNIPYGDKILNLRVGVQDPDGTPIGDILYVHGFADRLDNHGPLFESWNQAGFRVIAFDLPSHGENEGTANNLDLFDFTMLADLVTRVEQDTKPATPRPLLLSGWSTGGLIVARLVQKNWTAGLSRPIAGMILFAPGFSIRKTPVTFGDRLGHVTQSSLTHDPNPPHKGLIIPPSPFSKDLANFVASLLMNSAASQVEPYPTNLKTIVFTNGDSDDMYIKARDVRAWVDAKNLSEMNGGFPAIVNISCPHARHEVDNELPLYGSLEVQATAAEFAREVVANDGSSYFSKNQPFGQVCSRVDSSLVNYIQDAK